MKRLIAAAGFLVAACASSNRVDVKEPRHLVGTESDVVVRAQLWSNDVSPNSTIALVYELENNRSSPIGIAELVPDVTYDTETATITVHAGSEVPGNQLVPRVIAIQPGEKKSFNATARIHGNIAAGAQGPAPPRELRLAVHFLNDLAPFRQLVGIPETALADKELADRLFARWVESTESVTTNAIPVRWVGPQSLSEPMPRRSRSTAGHRP